MPRLIKVQTDLIETNTNEINEPEVNKSKTWIWLNLNSVIGAGEYNGKLYLIINNCGGMHIYSHTLEEFLELWKTNNE